MLWLYYKIKCFFGYHDYLYISDQDIKKCLKCSKIINFIPLWKYARMQKPNWRHEKLVEIFTSNNQILDEMVFNEKH